VVVDVVAMLTPPNHVDTLPPLGFRELELRSLSPLALLPSLELKIDIINAAVMLLVMFLVMFLMISELRCAMDINRYQVFNPDVVCDGCNAV